MNNKSEFGTHYSMLKRCEKVYNILFYVYLVSCIPAAAASFIIIFVRSDVDTFYLFIGMLFKIVLFITGVLSIYKKNIIFTWIPAAAAFLDIIVNGSDMIYLQSFLWMFDDINMIFLFISIISGAVLTYTHKKYHYLETCVGFPYFNERLSDQEYETRQRNIKDVYTQNYEKYKKSSSDHMDEI